jgi:glycosyltransferase involved in cell wall biosynthesis
MINNKVSIIMNCHNGEKYLVETINSLFKQTYKNWELIFFDNQSTDNSKLIINKFKDKRIKYFYSKFINLGLARKKALDLCSGKFITFLDVDDIWTNKKLEIQVVTLNKNKNCALCFSNSIFFEKNKKWFLYDKKPEDGFIFFKLLKKYYISFDTVLFTKKSLLSLDHHIDEKFNIIHDMDLIIRLSKKNKFIYIDYPLSYWRLHDKSFSHNKIRTINIEKINLLKKLVADEKNIKLRKKIYTLFSKNFLKTKADECIVSNKKYLIIKEVLNMRPFKLQNILYFFTVFMFKIFCKKN